MASGRMLQRKISKSHDMAMLIERVSAELGLEHGPFAALLFTWCIAHQDVEGRMHGDPRLVRADVFPLIEQITVVHIGVYLKHMHDLGLVIWYEVGGRRWLSFPGFGGAQPGLRKDREPPSAAPAPESGTPVAAGSMPAVSRHGAGKDPAECRQSAADDPGVRGRREEKRKEVEVEEKGSSADKPPLPFRAAAAVDTIATASAGHFVASVLTPKKAIDLEAVIRDEPTLEAWTLVGQWLAAGGDGWKGTLDVRHLGDIRTWFAHARQWDAKGRGSVSKQSSLPYAGPREPMAAVAKGGREEF